MFRNAKRTISCILVLGMVCTTWANAFAFGNGEVAGKVISQEHFASEGTEIRSITVYYEASDEFVTRTESQNYLAVSRRKGEQIHTEVYQKKSGSLMGEPQLIRSSDWSIGRARQDVEPQSRETYRSMYLKDDKYSYYDTLNTWHLYYGNSYVYSGDSPTKTILGHCRNFKKNLHEMDDEGTLMGEALLGTDSSADFVFTMRDIIIGFAEDGFCGGVKEIIEVWITNAVESTIPGLSVGSSIAEAVGHALRMYDAHEAYKKAFEYVQELTA